MKIEIDKKLLPDLRQWFGFYVNKFSYPDKESQKNIDLKREHTERVTCEIIQLGRQIGLSEDELCLAEIIALFHDIGRFEQYDRYMTFSDHKSENHAELGIKVLKEFNVLSKLDKEIQVIIFCSIKYHNRPLLPNNESETCLFYSKLIRDADKLDIWKVVTDYYHSNNREKNIALELELPETPGISDEIYQALMDRQIVKIKHVRNINDIKLLQAGWIYDINFKPTFESVKNRRYMKLLKDALPENKEISEIFKLIDLFILEH